MCQGFFEYRIEWCRNRFQCSIYKELKRKLERHMRRLYRSDQTDTEGMSGKGEYRPDRKGIRPSPLSLSVSLYIPIPKSGGSH